MGEDASAELAFSTAIKKDPRRWEAYYALAVNRFNKRDYDSVLTLANRVIQLRPHGAEAYDLKGIAQRLQVKTDLDLSDQDSSQSGFQCGLGAVPGAI
jgi:tetratricopeptide (TPR) repeat protein